MELSEATGVLASLRNTFRAVEKLGEVIDAARAADTALAEKTKAVDAKVAELAAVVADVETAKAAEAARSLDAEKAHSLRLAEQESQFDAIALSFTSIKARMQTELDDATSDRDTKGDTLANEIREMTQARDSLSQSVEQLKAEFAALKDRAARV